MPALKDPDVINAFKDLMAMNWDELSPDVVYDAKYALTKKTNDKDGQEVLADVFKAAAAVEEFTGILESLKMEIDDSIGLSGEGVKPLPEDFSKALQIAYSRYVEYLNAFGPEEGYLKKKVESEVGTRYTGNGFEPIGCDGVFCRRWRWRRVEVRLAETQ